MATNSELATQLGQAIRQKERAERALDAARMSESQALQALSDLSQSDYDYVVAEAERFADALSELAS